MTEDPDAVPPLRVVVTDGRGRLLSRRGLTKWLVDVAPASARGEVSVALVGDTKMRALNRRFRGVNRATDVLSFPADRQLHRGKSGRPFLGDIVIATGVAKRQARVAGHRAETEARRLALHGLLHLLGYDHEQDAGQMARLERRLLSRVGLEEHGA